MGEARQGRVGLVERLRQQGRSQGLHDRDVCALHRFRREDRRRIRDLRRGLERKAQHLGVQPEGRRSLPHRLRQQEGRRHHPVDGVGPGVRRGGEGRRALLEARREGLQGRLHGSRRRRGRELPRKVRGGLREAQDARRLPRRLPSSRPPAHLPERPQLRGNPRARTDEVGQQGEGHVLQRRRLLLPPHDGGSDGLHARRDGQLQDRRLPRQRHEPRLGRHALPSDGAHGALRGAAPDA